MKRALSVLILSCMLLVSGCNEVKCVEVINLVDAVETNEGNTTTDVAKQLYALRPEATEGIYSVNIEEYTAYAEMGEPFKVKYAQIAGLKDKSLESQINGVLKTSFTDWIKNEENIFLDKLQVTTACKTSEYLSLYSWIEWGEENVKPRTHFGITIDMQTGDRVYLDDLIPDTSALKQRLFRYRSEFSEISTGIDMKAVDQIVRYASMSENEYYKLRKSHAKEDDFPYIKPSFYLTESELVITRDEWVYDNMYIEFYKPSFFVKERSNTEGEYTVGIEEYTYDKTETPFKVRYVQVNDLKDKELEGRVNEALKLAATEWINESCNWVEKFRISTMCKTAEYLSVYYLIEWGNDPVKPCSRFGITIDMQTGNRVYLSDLVDNTSDLNKILTRYKHSSTEFPTDVDKVIYEASISETEFFQEIYLEQDEHVYQELDQWLRAKASFYLTDKQLVVTGDEWEFEDVYVEF